MPQVETETLLRLVEKAGTLVFWDIESTGREADYDSMLVSTLKPIGKKPITFAIEQVGNDKKVARLTGEELGKYDVWVTYFGKGFDWKFLNTRLLKWGMQPIEPKLHIDMYFSVASKLLTGRKSQAHILDFLGTKQRKMSVSPNVWAEAPHNEAVSIPTLVKRCESDVAGLEAMYQRTKHLIRDVKR